MNELMQMVDSKAVYISTPQGKVIFQYNHIAFNFFSIQIEMNY